jgi:hypothetical protein
MKMLYEHVHGKVHCTEHKKVAFQSDIRWTAACKMLFDRKFLNLYWL